MRKRIIGVFLGASLLAIASASYAKTPSPSDMDRDLIEITVPQLQRFYAEHKYTVTQVVQWYLARIKRYDGIYRAVETLMDKDALAVAAREDADKAGGAWPAVGRAHRHQGQHQHRRPGDDRWLGRVSPLPATN